MAKLALLGGEPLHKNGFPGWPQITDADRDLMKKTAEGKFARGEVVADFERRFADYCGVRHCIAVANGTVSLELILRALGIGFGDEVILPPYTFIATLSSIVFSGAKPVFADIDRETYNLSPSDAERKITSRTKAVIAVAVGGRPCDFDAFEALAKKCGIYLIVDAAQAVGARWKNVSIGKYGVAASFSCQNTKNLASGEGGMITTDSDDLNDSLRTILNGGLRGGRYVSAGSFNGMNDFQATILTSQLLKLDGEILKREKNAAYLDGRLHKMQFSAPTAHDPRITVHAYHLYIVRFFSSILSEKGLTREKLLKAANAEGVPIGKGYSPLYRFKCVSSEQTCRVIGGKIDIGELPECAEASDREGSWMYQSVLLGSFEDMDDIADAFLKIWENADELRGEKQ